MKLHDVKQGTAEWLALRAGILTASEMDNLVTPELAFRKGKTPESYLHRKIAERWLGTPMMSFSGGVMEQGQLLETEALPWFEAMYDVDVERPGFITTNDGSVGCSPDGWIPGGKLNLGGKRAEVDGAGLEAKCPQPPNHVEWLMAGVCPKDHWMQCQAGIYVTGAGFWWFMSYCRGFPALVVRVERDEAAMKVIQEAAIRFNAMLKAGIELLIEKNGGPPTPPAFDTTIEGDTVTRTLRGPDLSPHTIAQSAEFVRRSLS